MTTFLQFLAIGFLVALGALSLNGVLNVMLFRPAAVTRLRLSPGEELLCMLLLVTGLVISVAGCLTLWP